MEGAAGGLVFFAIWGGIMLLVFGGIVLAIWALVDLLNKPEWAWPYAGENRTTYIVLLAASFFVCQFLAWIPAIMYFKGVKPKLQRVLETMPPPVMPGPYGGYGYGPPPGQWYQPNAGQQAPPSAGPYRQPAAPTQDPTGTWTSPEPRTDYPSPGQGVPQGQGQGPGQPASDEWWRHPGANPPQG